MRSPLRIKVINRVQCLEKSIDELSWGFEYREKFQLKKGIAFKLGRAGHILGSCWIQFDISDYMTVVFSGERIRLFCVIRMCLMAVIC